MKELLVNFKHKPWLIPICGLLLSFVFAWLATSSPTTTVPQDPLGLDTYIPRGYVLVPIEVQNYESLDSVIGQYGVVDLYRSHDLIQKKGRPLAKAVKLLRAPKNPSQFGVLVPEEDAPLLVKQGEPFYVVVQRPDKSGTSFEKAKAKVKSMVVYEEESHDVETN